MHDLLTFSCRFRKVSKQFSVNFSKATAKRRYFFLHNSVQQTKNLFNYVFAITFLALTSSVINLTNTALIFHDFPGLENEIRKFPDFQGFLWPVHPWFHEPWAQRRHGLKVVVFFSFLFFFKQQLEQGYISVFPLFSGSFFPACLTIFDHTLIALCFD